MPEISSISSTSTEVSGTDGDRDDVLKSENQRGSLSEAEEQFIAYFVELTRLLAIPKSVGEVYGLLYSSPSPLCVAEITEKLGVCKATVSYAMRFLANINAITVIKEFGNRNDFFVATTSLRQLASGFLAERVEPFMAQRNSDIDAMEAAFSGEVAEDSERGEFVRKRIKTLRSWNRRGRMFAPLLRRLFRIND